MAAFLFQQPEAGEIRVTVAGFAEIPEHRRQSFIAGMISFVQEFYATGEVLVYDVTDPAAPQQIHHQVTRST